MSIFKRKPKPAPATPSLASELRTLLPSPQPSLLSELRTFLPPTPAARPPDAPPATAAELGRRAHLKNLEQAIDRFSFKISWIVEECEHAATWGRLSHTVMVSDDEAAGVVAGLQALGFRARLYTPRCANCSGTLTDRDSPAGRQELTVTWELSGDEKRAIEGRS